MNGLKKLTKGFRGKDKAKNLILSIVILIEVISILMVATFAWVETVSSIKITNKEDEAIVDTYVFTHAMIGSKSGTIDLGKYFKQSGDMHLAPASSADGKNFYFPQTASVPSAASTTYRKGNVNDKNTVYMSATFKLRADTNADFFFTEVPTFSSNEADIRVSVTAYSEGADPDTHVDQTTGQTVSNTRIYALTKRTASSNNVVNSTNGGTKATAVEAFSDHDIDGRTSSARLFSVGAEETKIVTINLWLQGTSASSNLSSQIDISNFGLKSDLTPRHVTLIPTPTWDVSNETQYYYAWCWGSTKGDADKLYKLELDENEHYSFDYNGTYQNTLFIRAKRKDLTTANMSNQWNYTYIHNRTNDTSIPASPVDPTFIIETINGGDNETGDLIGNNAKKSTGSWSDPVKINLAYTTTPADQDAMGSLAATTYIGTSTSTHVMEQTNSSSQKHQNLIHGWTGKRLKLSATAKTVSGNAQYAFEGWYSSADGAAANRLSTNKDYDFNITAAAGSEVTYYAKFKEVRKITLKQYIDGSSSSNAATLALTSTGATSTGNNTSKSIIVDKNATVTLKETLTDSGYSFSGFYNVQSGGSALTGVTTSGTTKSVNITANSANYETTYYARFTANSYSVTAHAYYSVDGGTNYTADDATGGTVKVGSATAGATSTAGVKYKNTVTLVAAPASGYEFVGWYNAATGGTQLSTNTSYTYTLSTTGAKDVYARFIGEEWAIKYGVSGGSNWSTVNMTASGNTVTGTMKLTEGQDFSFKIYKKAGSTETWYGGGGSYSNITSTSFISNLTLSTTGGDTYMKGHAGTYTFTFNKSTKVLNVTASYSNITITFDYSDQTWWGNDSAVISFYDGSGESNMSNGGTNKKTISVSSTRGNSGNVGFNRWNNTSHSTFWNNVNAGTRGYSTTYKVGSGWQ